MVKNITKAELVDENKDLERKLKEAQNALASAERVAKKFDGEKVDMKAVEGDERAHAENVQIEQEEDFDIRPDAYISVISLCPNPLNLSEGNGNRALRFRKFGESKRILYQKLVSYIDNHPLFAENGVFYIADKRVVRRHGLDDFYNKIITKSEIEDIMVGDYVNAIKIFNSANITQQRYVSEMLIKKLIAGEDVDMNLSHQVGQTLGIDISKKAKESEDFGAILNEE